MCDRSRHIHSCRRRELSLVSESTEYCYRCCTWFKNNDDFDHHCRSHLIQLDPMCEVWTYRNTLVTPGICPFCVGQDQLPATKRYHQFPESFRLWRHVDRHLLETLWPGPCPHPLCDLVLKDAEDFNCHMIDIHGKDIVTRNVSKRKFEDSSDKSTKSEENIEAEVLTRLGTERGYKIPSWVCRPKLGTEANQPRPYPMQRRRAKKTNPSVTGACYEGMHVFQAVNTGLTIDNAFASASANLLVNHDQVSSLMDMIKNNGPGSRGTKRTSEPQLRGQGNDKKTKNGYRISLYPEDSHCSLVDVPQEGFNQDHAPQCGDGQQSLVGNILRPLILSPEGLSDSPIGYSPGSPSWNGFEEDDKFDEDEMGAMVV